MDILPSRVVMPCPFAGGDGASYTEPDSASSEATMNWQKGFGANYGVPASNGGKYVTRAEMNGLGRVATQDMFYHKCGGLNTFDAEFANAVGGYPKGAVLQILDDGRLFYVESLKPNNLVDFRVNGVDGINWRYCYESKYEQDEEKFLYHYENDGLIAPPSEIKTTSILSKQSSVSGYLTIRNLYFEFAQGHAGYNSGHNNLVGNGIIARSVSPSEMSSYSDLEYTTSSADAAKWKLISSLSGFVKQGLANQYNVSTGVITYVWELQHGLHYVNAGDYIYINILNGYIRAGHPEDMFGNIKKLIFDLYII